MVDTTGICAFVSVSRAVSTLRLPRCCSLFERDSRMAVIRHRLRLRAYGGSDVALVLDHLEDGGRAQRILPLVRIQSLLRESERFHRGIVSRTRLLESNHGILYVDANLIGALLQIQFVLTYFE